MTRKELEDYIKERHYYCEFCGGLRREVMEKGLDAIKNYKGMICGGVEDMKMRLYEVEDWEKGGEKNDS
jgi:hypothetical protein